MKTEQQIINEAATKIGALVHPAASLDEFKSIVAFAIKENAECARATRSPRPDDFTYVVSYGGGIGPDVWDKEMTISAVDINDAISQASSRMEECCGWVFMVYQEDYPQTAREKMEIKIRELEASLETLTSSL
jgi:hypothetical protein